MADILIRGMEMPKSCGYCPVKKFDPVWGDCCPFHNEPTEYQKRPDDCPLVELPEHGDLIDRDAIAFEDNIYGWRDKKIVKAAPVIVPSNKEDTE